MTKLPIHLQNGIDDACTQKDDHPNRTTNIGGQFPREEFGWWRRRERVTLRIGTLFFQLDNGCSFVFRVVCDTILCQNDKGRVVPLVPLLDLQVMIELPELTNTVDESTLQHMTEIRRKLGSCGFAL